MFRDEEELRDLHVQGTGGEAGQQLGRGSQHPPDPPGDQAHTQVHC